MCEVLKVVDDLGIHKRHAGCATVVGSKVYFWGGTTSIELTLDSDVSDSDEDDSTEENEQQAMDNVIRVVKTLPLPDDNKHRFDMFDLESLVWSRQTTYGKLNDDVPSVGNGSTLNYHKPTNTLFLFSGWNDRQFSSDVFYVSMDTWKWEKAEQEVGDIVPSPRYLTGVLIHNNKLCNFGGVGPDIGRDQDIGSDYHPYITPDSVYDFGWNNQYFEFDIELKKWNAPMSGQGKHRPPPVGGHVFTKFDQHRALYFGGRRENGRTNITYIFDLDGKEFHGPLKMDVSPTCRTFATLCPLIDPEMVGIKFGPAVPPLEQKLFLLWGKKTDNEIIPDSWVFDAKKKQWNQVELNEDGRYWHIACSYFPQPTQSSEGQIIIYGGAKQDKSTEHVSFIGQRGLTILVFGVKTLRRLCVSVVTSALLEHYNGLQIGSSAEDLLGELHIPSKLRKIIFQSFKAKFVCQDSIQ